jgi:hypothetical protein
VLGGNTQFTGNCVENSSKLRTTGVHLLSETEMCSRFSWGKQTNKQTKQKNIFYNFFLNGLPYVSVTVYAEMVYHWIVHTLQHTALCFGNK